jgi:hypothetical protein
MPGSEAIPMSRLSLFYGWSLVVGGWSSGELNSEASRQRISLEGG